MKKLVLAAAAIPFLSGCGGSGGAAYTPQQVADIFAEQTGLCQEIVTTPDGVDCLREQGSYTNFDYSVGIYGSSEEEMREELTFCSSPPDDKRVFGVNWQATAFQGTNDASMEDLEFLQSMFGGEIISPEEWCAKD